MDPIERLTRDPARAALLLDVDGTLAPIVPRPEDARVPDETRAELERLHARYRLVACVSGRTSEDTRRVVGIDALTYVGVHGLELDPEAESWRPALQKIAERATWPEDETQDKGIALTLHFRRAEDEQAARARLEQIAAEAREAGLTTHFGRKMLEVRPPVDADKGTAVRTLLERADVVAALYAGDDTTDLDAFRGLREAGLERAVCVAVMSEEAPSRLREGADLAVEGPAGMVELLRQL